MHFLDVTTWAWHRPTTDGVPPSVRLGSSAAFMGGQMIIFGGYGAGARLNDLHTLDLTSWQWQQPAFTGTAPSPRQSAAIALHGECPSMTLLEQSIHPGPEFLAMAAASIHYHSTIPRQSAGIAPHGDSSSWMLLQTDIIAGVLSDVQNGLALLEYGCCQQHLLCCD